MNDWLINDLISRHFSPMCYYICISVITVQIIFAFLKKSYDLLGSFQKYCYLCKV